MQAGPKTFQLIANGLASFAFNGTVVFRLEGGFILNIDATPKVLLDAAAAAGVPASLLPPVSGISLAFAADLRVGTKAAPYLTFNASGLMKLGFDEAGLPGFAMYAALHIDAALGSFGLNGEFMIALNSFGHAINFDIPTTNPVFPTFKDEKGNTIETIRMKEVEVLNADGTVKLDAAGHVITVLQEVRSVAIPGGAPKLTGGYEPDAPYFVLRGNASLAFNDPDVSISGQFFISLTPSKLEINVSGLIIAGSFTFEAAGAFILANEGGYLYAYGAVLAKIKVGTPGASAPDNEKAGIYLAGAGMIALNTDIATGRSHDVTLITPAIAATGTSPAQPAGLRTVTVAPGFKFIATLVVSFRAEGKELFRIEGGVLFELSTSPLGVKFVIAGKLMVGPEDKPILTLRGNAIVYFGEISGKWGFAAAVNVSLEVGVPPISGLPGVEITASFSLMANTFGADVTFDLGVKNDPVFTFPALVDADGAPLETERTAAPSQAHNPDGSLKWELNPDGSQKLDGSNNPIPVMETLVYRQVLIPGGAPDLLTPGSFLAPAPYLMIKAKGSLTIGGFVLKGGFGFLVTPTKFQLSVNASIELGSLGSVKARGILEISTSGILGAIELELAADFGSGAGISFEASFKLALNTTSEVRNVTFGDGTTLVIRPGIRIEVHGKMNIGSAVQAGVDLLIVFDALNASFRLEGKASIDLAGGLLSIKIEIGVAVGPDGIALVADVSVDVTIADVVKIKAAGKLYINTGASAVTFTLLNKTVPGKSFYLELEGEITIIEIFTIRAKIVIAVGTEFDRPDETFGGTMTKHVTLGMGEWAFAFEGDVSFFGIVTVQVRGFVQSNGAFGMYFYGGFKLGGRALGIEAYLKATVYYDGNDNFGFSAHGGITLYILYIGISLDAGFSYDSSSGRLYVTGTVEIDLWLTTISISKTIEIGYLEKPKPAFLGMDAQGNPLGNGSNVGASGQLYLTMGRADVRKFHADDNNETYTVKHVSTQSDGSETVEVVYLGRTATFTGVRQIIANGDSGNETLYVNENVVSQVVANGGGGNDEYYIAGGSTTVMNIINAGDGNDKVFNTTTSSTIRYSLDGGSGDNILEGGSGADVIRAGSGKNQITGGLGNDVIYTGTGIAYIVSDNGTFTGTTVTATGSSGGDDTVYAGTGTNFIVLGAGSDTIYGGGNNFIISDNGTIEFNDGTPVRMLSTDPSVAGNDFINNTTSNPLIAIAGSGNDTVNGGSGTDLILAGNGSIDFHSNGKVRLLTSDDTDGGNDILNLADGQNTAFGGAGNDNITGGNSRDIFGGDNGTASFDSNGNLISFTDPGTGGDDVLSAGAGNNVLIGGGGNDTITGAEGNDVIIGDEGTATFNVGGFLTSITTINYATAGNDIISGGDGNNVILGGSGADRITLGLGYSVVLGDNGSATFSDVGVIATIQTTATSSGDADIIRGTNGNNIIFGGTGADDIDVNDLGDVILGDFGSATFDASGVLLSLSTSDAGSGAADIIKTGVGANVIFGGAGADQITGGIGDDVLLGDYGTASFLSVGGKSILSQVLSSDTSTGDDDVLKGGGGKNVVFGGAGADSITSGAGSNILVGDNGQADFNSTGLLTSIKTINAAVGGVDTITSDDGRTIVLGGAGADNITTGRGDDVIIGDSGVATFVTAGNVPSGLGKVVFSNDGILKSISTSDPSVGADDIIVANDGFNVILGGFGSDSLTGGTGRDVVIGDNGSADFDNAGVLLVIQSSDATVAGVANDTITVGNGADIVIGGNGADNVKAAGDNSDDIVLGDNGKATFDSVAGASILRDILSTDTTAGAADVIDAGDGYNIVIGGPGKDDITGGENTDVVLGDNGHAVFNASSVLTFITTIDAATGDDDLIKAGDGLNTILAGSGADTINGAEGSDVVVGDNGNATFNDTGVLTFITTSDVNFGGNDIVHVADGYNVVLIGSGSDEIIGGVNTDVVIGDNGNASFTNDGILTDIISTDPDVGGDDNITTGDGFNAVLAGFGKDTINGGADRDVIVGDNGHAQFTDAGVLTFITTTSPDIGGDDVIKVGSGDNIIIGGFGKDDITGGADRDVVIGDNGNATFTTAGILTYITTSDPSIGGDDAIKVGDGDNIIIGGFGKDDITGGANRDVVIGDNGNATFADAGILTYITTSDPSIGGDDLIKVGDGDNIIIGGFGKDDIAGGANRDVVIGDNGNATFTDAGVLTYITTSDPTIGGDDLIKVADGDNFIIGGFGMDDITGGADRDVVIGDNGNATFTDAGILTYITTSDPSIGGDDVIKVGNGDNIIIGGFGKDDITGGAVRDVVIGDNGNATFTDAGILIYITTSDPSIGDDDLIKVGDGDNIIIGGFGKDDITGGADRDVVIGDNGNATFTDAGVLTYITTSDPTIGGDDIIVTGDGFNIVLGGIGADRVTGGADRDVMLGDNGNAAFDTTGVLTLIQTSDAAEAGGYNDTILGLEGDNVIFGGNGKDSITTGAGEDVVLGDNGRAQFDSTAGVSVIRDIISTDTSIGDDDTIIVGDGKNVTLGGFGKDDITGGANTDIGTGDSGHAVFNASGILTYITTISPAIGDDDLIKVGNGDNIFLAGFGKDQVIGGADRDVIVGDNGNATFTDVGVLTYVTTSEPTIGNDDIIDVGNGFNVVLAGIGADNVTGGSGRDIVVGDNGNATFDTTGVLTLIQTSDAAEPGSYDDVIKVGEDDNVVLAGNGKDQITSLSGNDVIVGDNGKAVFDSTAGHSIMRDITSTDTGIGDDDIILAGEGNNVILGGFGKDQITSGDGNDIGTGDSGHAIFNAAGVLTFIETISPAIGDVDTIKIGGGNNVFLGGNGGDSIISLGGNDILVGDNGFARITDVGVLTYITTTDPSIGGDDVIDAGAGNNTVLGGVGADKITTTTGNDNIVGDNGNATFTDVGVLTFLTTSDPTLGGDDTIDAGAGNNNVLGGVGADKITTTTGNDNIVGDNGNATFTDVGVLTFLTTSDPTLGGDDVIDAGAGNNNVLGGIGSDTISTLGGNDNIAGDNANATFTDLGILTLFTTSQPELGGDDVIKAGDGRNIVLGGNGADNVTTGVNDDVVIGDNGYATFNSINGVIIKALSTDPLLGGGDTIEVSQGYNVVIGGVGADKVHGGGAGSINFVNGDGSSIGFDANGLVSTFTTVDSSLGDDDVITLDRGGVNYVIAGAGSDTVTIGDGTSTVLGDEGEMVFKNGLRVHVNTLNSGVGTRDIIKVGNGYSTIIGGAGSDIINTLGGTNHIFGDEARFDFGLNGTTDSAYSLNPNVAGNDIIETTGAGITVVVGGSGSDSIATDSGWHVIVGDNADLDWRGAFVSEIETIFDDIGGNDHISVHEGYSVVFGGKGLDFISDGNGSSFLVGDNGHANLAGGVVHKLYTEHYDSGSDDTIIGGTGRDTIFGGSGSDYIDGGSGNDVIVGDQGSYNWHGNSPGHVTLDAEKQGGNDTLVGSGGDDLLYGEGGDDVLDGGSGNDSLFGSYGDDALFGGEGDDILVGGPGGDFLDGGFGHDTLYVDIFDTWIAMPEDTVIGGPFWSTGLLILNGATDPFGLNSGGSALDNVMRAFARLRHFRMSATNDSSQYIYQMPSEILISDLTESIRAHGYDAIRWGGVGGVILLLQAHTVISQILVVGGQIQLP